MAEAAGTKLQAVEDVRLEERVLVDQVRRVGQSPKGYFAVHIHLSQLRVQYRQPHYLRIAARAFDNLINGNDATLYKLSNADMVLLCRNVPVENVDPPIVKLRTLFSEDPLTFGAEGSLDDRFTTWYDLSQAADYTSFLAVVEGLLEEGVARRRRELETGERADHTMLGEPLSPANLTAISARLQTSRIDDLIRQQAAVEIRPGARARVLFREHYVSMFDLQKRIAPNTNLFASPWLFLFLTETIDRRALAHLGQTDLAASPDPISVNLNVSTVLSTGFQAFHEKARGHADKVVVELQTIDVFSDLGGYLSARDWLREHSYRVLIDGLNPLALQFFDPGLLDADFVKLNWSHEFLAGVPDQRINDVRAVIDHIGRERVILARAESEKALKWAITLGVIRFQDRFIDRLMQVLESKAKA